MATQMNTARPGFRMQLGASVLAAARAVDTTLVKERLKRFEQAHKAYTAAQKKVDAAESNLRSGQARLADFDAVQDDAVDALARALVMDGQPRANPFDAFGAPAPGMLTRLAFNEAAAVVHQLVAAVLRSKGVTEPTVQAAHAANKAAAALEQEIGPVAKLQDDVRDARRMRDAVAQLWESALAALRRGTKAAADDGAPNLHATLFPPVTRTRPKKVEEPVAVAAPTQPATPNAA